MDIGWSIFPSTQKSNLAVVPWGCPRYLDKEAQAMQPQSINNTTQNKTFPICNESLLEAESVTESLILV